MCNNIFNIKVVEGNEFPIILRLQALSYNAVPPIAEQIDYTRLTNCVFKVGGVQYNIEITEDGVRAIMPATLALGDYNVEFAAKYEESDIRAAYLRAITIVKWNEQSNAGECLLGSPVVLPAAIVIGGTLTDAELEELKQETREKNAQLAQAIADADAAKAEWERKAAELDGVAKEQTSQQILTAIDGIDTSTLAKQGSNPNANISDIQAAVAALPTLQEMQDAGMIRVSYDGVKFDTPLTFRKLSDILLNLGGLEEIVDNDITVITTPLNVIAYRSNISTFKGYVNLKKFVAQNVISIPEDFAENTEYRSLSNLEHIDLRCLKSFSYRTFYGCKNLKYVNVLNAVGGNLSEFYDCINLIDIVYGAGLTESNKALSSWSPTNALSSTSSSLVEPDETFANNLEKLLYNIREHIAALLPDRTGLASLTLTVSANIKAAINGDTATANAFANKNWIIA